MPRYFTSRSSPPAANLEAPKIRRTLFALLVIGLGACGDDGTAPESLVGRYTLQTVDGNPLPFVIIEVGTDKVEVTAAHINLNQDLTCSDSFTLVTTEDGIASTETETDICTYTTNNTGITVTFVGDDPFDGSIVGSQLTISDNGIVFIYQK
jgi:hypothetical protein